MTTPIVITDAMRDAVHAEDCDLNGHMMTATQALDYSRGYGRLMNTEGLVPHLMCTRCGKVYLIVEDGGRNYADAETRLNAQLKTPKPPRTRTPK